LLDDPISALDAHVRLNIMKNVVNGMLKGKTRIIVTHAIDFLHMADRIIMMDKGKITAQGTYKELSTNDEFIKLQEINALNKDDVKDTAHHHGKEEDAPEVETALDFRR
jgi:ABC-type multidrug transport system fused ATPase/permease subunit